MRISDWSSDVCSSDLRTPERIDTAPTDGGGRTVTRPAATCVGFVPARSGSRRVPDKNVRPLAGHPLLAYAIRSAIDSGVFQTVIVATDSAEYAAIARHYGAEVPFLRPPSISGDTSPDIARVRFALDALAAEGRGYDEIGRAHV